MVRSWEQLPEGAEACCSLLDGAGRLPEPLWGSEAAAGWSSLAREVGGPDTAGRLWWHCPRSPQQ